MAQASAHLPHSPQLPLAERRSMPPGDTRRQQRRRSLHRRSVTAAPERKQPHEQLGQLPVAQRTHASRRRSTCGGATAVAAAWAVRLLQEGCEGEVEQQLCRAPGGALGRGVQGRGQEPQRARQLRRHGGCQQVRWCGGRGLQRPAPAATVTAAMTAGTGGVAPWRGSPGVGFSHSAYGLRQQRQCVACALYTWYTRTCSNAALPCHVMQV